MTFTHRANWCLGAQLNWFDRSGMIGRTKYLRPHASIYNPIVSRVSIGETNEEMNKAVV